MFKLLLIGSCLFFQKTGTPSQEIPSAMPTAPHDTLTPQMTPPLEKDHPLIKPGEEEGIHPDENRPIPDHELD